MTFSARALACALDDGNDHVPGRRVRSTRKEKGVVFAEVRCILCGGMTSIPYDEWYAIFHNSELRELITQLEHQAIRQTERRPEEHEPPA